jgi:hypothetical protein
MTAPDDHLVRLLFSLVLVIPSSYLAGRVHQWYMHSLRRDSAFQDGYNHASRAMFTLAVRHRTRGSGPVAPEPAVEAAPELAFASTPEPTTAAVREPWETAEPPDADRERPDADLQPAGTDAGRNRKLTGSAARLPGLPGHRRSVESLRAGLLPRRRAGNRGRRLHDPSR